MAQEARIIQEHFAEDSQVWAVHLYEMGYLSYVTGDKADAEKQMTASLEFALRTDDLIAQACAYRGLGEILSSRYHFEKARDLFRQAGDDIGCQQANVLIQRSD